MKKKSKGDVFLKVDGKPISLNSFVKGFLVKTIKGMLSSLKGCDKAERIEIRIESDK